MHALSAFQKRFLIRLPCRAPAHVNGYIGLCRVMYRPMKGYTGLCGAMSRFM